MYQVVLTARGERTCSQVQLVIEGEKAHFHRWGRLRSFLLRPPLDHPGFASVASSFLWPPAVFHTAGNVVAPLAPPDSSHWLPWPEPRLAASAHATVPTVHPGLLRFPATLPWDAARAILSCRSSLLHSVSAKSDHIPASGSSCILL